VSLAVLCPSRGRPDKAVECYRSFLDTKHSADTEMLFVLDADDDFDSYAGLPSIVVMPTGRRGMTDPVNTAIRSLWDRYDIVGFVGDDHRFRTSGWDRVFVDQLGRAGGGLVYGNDKNWRDGEIPTQIFGSAAIWRALGWMALPACQHLYLDNAWRHIGESLERLYYFPDVIIEHMHPAYAKAEWDEGYRAVNSSEMYNHDRAAFEDWVAGSASEDLDRVRRALDLA